MSMRLFYQLERVLGFNDLTFSSDLFCSPAIQDNRVATAQGLSGTGSLRIGAEFLSKHHHEVGFIVVFMITFYELSGCGD